MTTRSSTFANLRYQQALDWRKWTKGGCSFLLFVRAVLIELSLLTVTVTRSRSKGFDVVPGSTIWILRQTI